MLRQFLEVDEHVTGFPLELSDYYLRLDVAAQAQTIVDNGVGQQLQSDHFLRGELPWNRFAA